MTKEGVKNISIGANQWHTNYSAECLPMSYPEANYVRAGDIYLVFFRLFLALWWGEREIKYSIAFLYQV